MRPGLLRREWKFLLFGFLLSFFSSPGQTFFIGLFNDDIRNALALSHGELGAYYSIATLASAVLIVWTGSLIDRLDLRHFTLGLILAAALGCLLLAASRNVLMLICAFFLLRHFAAGLMPMTSSTSMVRYLHRDKAKANALAGMGYRSAETILPALILLYLAHNSWQSGLWLMAAVMVFALVPIVLFLLRDHTLRHTRLTEEVHEQGTVDYAHSWTRAQVIRDPRFYLSIPALVSGGLIFTGIIFHQAYMLDYKQWSGEFWGFAFIVYGLTSIISALLTGGIADRYGAIPSVPVAGIPLAVALLFLGLGNSESSGLWFMFLMGISIGASSTLGGPFFSEMYGNRHLGAIKSLSSAVLVFSTALSPVIVGHLLDRGVAYSHIALGSAVYVALACLCAALAYCLTVRHGAQRLP